MPFHDVEQNTVEWLNLRRGIVTASDMYQVLVSPRSKSDKISASAKTYRNKIVAERATGRFASNFYNDDMERGHTQEEYAVRWYERYTGEKVKCGGFYTAFDEIGRVGYSPDGMVGDDGLIEIKSRRDDLQIGFLIGEDEIPKPHYAQMQCGLWVTGRKWCDYISFNDYLPPFIQRVIWDDEFIETMARSVADFYVDVVIQTDKVLKIMAETSYEEPDIIDEYVKSDFNVKDYMA